MYRPNTTRVRHAGPLAAAAAGLLLGAAAPAAAAAQAPAAGAPATARDSAWSRPGPLLTRGDLARLGVSLAASGALMPFDERIAHWMQRPALQQNGGLRNTATVFRNFGDPGTLVLSVAAYGTGLVFHDRTTADVGLHATGAIAVGSVVTGIIKFAAGRARPYAVADSNAHDYGFGRGLRRGAAYQSLPSGHTTAAFAFAAVVASEARHRSPHAGHVVAPLAYGAATLVALSRLYNNDHWASDVALAASIGTVSGLGVVRYEHAHPDDWRNRRLLPAAALASAGPRTSTGDAARPAAMPPVALAWTVRFR